MLFREISATQDPMLRCNKVGFAAVDLITIKATLSKPGFFLVKVHQKTANVWFEAMPAGVLLVFFFAAVQVSSREQYCRLFQAPICS